MRLTPSARAVVGLAVVALAVASCAGRTAGSGAMLEVHLEADLGFTDAPSSYLVSVTPQGRDDPVLTAATASETFEGTPLDLLRTDIAPGAYALSVAQHGCGMSGWPCPGDPSSAQYADPVWRCAVEVVLDEGQEVTVDVLGDGTGPRRCTAG